MTQRLNNNSCWVQQIIHFHNHKSLKYWIVRKGPFTFQLLFQKASKLWELCCVDEIVSQQNEKQLSRVWLFETPWTTDYAGHGILQARILPWAAVPFSGELPNPKTEPRSPALPLAILHQHWHYTKSSSKLEDHLKKGGLDFPPKDQQLYSNCGVELFFLGTTSSYCFSISSRSYCILVRAK